MHTVTNPQAPGRSGTERTLHPPFAPNLRRDFRFVTRCTADCGASGPVDEASVDPTRRPRPGPPRGPTTRSRHPPTPDPAAAPMPSPHCPPSTPRPAPAAPRHNPPHHRAPNPARSEPLGDRPLSVRVRDRPSGRCRVCHGVHARGGAGRRPRGRPEDPERHEPRSPLPHCSSFADRRRHRRPRRPQTRAVVTRSHSRRRADGYATASTAVQFVPISEAVDRPRLQHLRSPDFRRHGAIFILRGARPRA